VSIAPVNRENGQSHAKSEPPPSGFPRDVQRIAVVVNGRAKNVTAEVISTRASSPRRS
jgi:hypothetical protein